MVGDPESDQVRELLRMVDRELTELRALLETGGPLPPKVRQSLEIRQELLLRMATALVDARQTPEHSPLLGQLITSAAAMPEEDLERLVHMAARIEGSAS